MAAQNVFTCDNPIGCASYHAWSSSFCATCLQRMISEYNSREQADTFTPEQEELIQEFMEENKDLMEDLAKGD